jgi:hypothetical protein
MRTKTEPPKSLEPRLAKLEKRVEARSLETAIVFHEQWTAILVDFDKLRKSLENFSGVYGREGILFQAEEETLEKWEAFLSNPHDRGARG